jgi:hypothetical protein
MLNICLCSRSAPGALDGERLLSQEDNPPAIMPTPAMPAVLRKFLRFVFIRLVLLAGQ